MEATQDTHTHTHAGRPEVAVNLFSAFSHPGPSFLKDPPGAVGSFAAPGDQVKWTVHLWSGMDMSSVILHVFTVGVLSGGNPLWTRGEHANSTQKGPGDSVQDLPPRANSAPCGNRTHDLLAVRQQCKHLSHRATDNRKRYCYVPVLVVRQTFSLIAHHRLWADDHYNRDIAITFPAQLLSFKLQCPYLTGYYN